MQERARPIDALIAAVAAAAKAAAAATAVLVLSACVTASEEDDGACAGASDDVCLEALAEDSDWTRMSRPSPYADQVRTSKYLVPVDEQAGLPTLFMNANRYETHWQFLRQGFPERFGTLSNAEYESMILDPVHRVLFAGELTEYLVPGRDRVFGFVVWDQQTPEDTLSCAQIMQVHRALHEAIAIAPVAVVAATRWQRQVLADCPVPAYDPSQAVAYEAYQPGYAYGTLRRYTLDELPGATARGAIGWRDIVVFDEAPFDVETVIAGAVTGSRQGELSHLNVRSAARGTPNCYLQNAHALLARYEGQLVRITCDRHELRIVPATLEQAVPWWDALRPEPVIVPAPDRAWTEMIALHDLPTGTREDRARGMARYGAKGTNLAALYQRIPRAYQLDGFLLPFHHYDAFMRSGRWTVDLGRGPEELSFARTIERYLDDPGFHSDTRRRRDLLNGLRAAMRTADCDPTLIEALHARSRAAFGSDMVMLRFRSSSNAEDALRFSGAGLYSSASACPADDADGDLTGPSRCDADKEREHTMCSALTEVWSSLWKPQAFDERAWYGIDHLEVGMAVLINTRSDDEQANAVAFSGIPGASGPGAERYLINAQPGEEEVVSLAPGTWPEKDLLTIGEGGDVIAIERARGSSLLPDHMHVLDDEQLSQIGALLWVMTAHYPVDEQAPPGRRVLLDTEWKVLSDGRLVIKQVRPFLD